MNALAMTAEKTRRTLLTQLNEKLIPWAQSKSSHRIVLAQPPITVSRGVSVSWHPGAPLQELAREPARDFLYYWPEVNLHSLRSPRLCCVLEGDVDWRIGITEQTSARLQGAASQCDYHVVSMKPGTFLVIPPGVPYSDGRTVHWERSPLVQPHSRVFWLQVLQTGVFCHFCECLNGVHSSGSVAYFPDASIKFYVEEMIEELRNCGPNYDKLSQTALLTVLWRLERSLSTKHFVQTHVDAVVLAVEPLERLVAGDGDPVVRRACEFIQSRLRESLSVEMIATHVHLSATHLNRLFQIELGKSIMQVVSELRFGLAKTLLRNTELLVQEIAEMVGYEVPSQFARAFLRREAVSPSRYRAAARAQSLPGDSVCSD